MNNDTENYICGNMNWMRKRRRNQNLHLFQVYFRNCWCHNTLVKFMTHFSLKRQVDSINFLIKLHNTTTKYKAKTAITNLITSFEVVLDVFKEMRYDIWFVNGFFDLMMTGCHQGNLRLKMLYKLAYCYLLSYVSFRRFGCQK